MFKSYQLLSENWELSQRVEEKNGGYHENRKDQQYDGITKLVQKGFGDLKRLNFQCKPSLTPGGNIQ